MGRGRKPTATHKRDGTFRHDRHSNRANIAPGKPSPPAWLTKEAKTEWNRLVPLLFGAGLLTLADRSTLALHCQSLSDYQKFREIGEKEGWTVEGSQGQVVEHPALRAMRRAWDEVLKSGHQLGLSPLARGAIKVETPTAKVDNDEQELFGVVG